MYQPTLCTSATLIRDSLAACLVFGICTLIGCSDSPPSRMGNDLTNDNSQADDLQFDQGDDFDSLTLAQHINLELASHAELMKKIEGMRGHFVVLDIWSTSCPPCLEELPNLMKLANDPSLDVRCVSFNLDYIGLKNKPPAEYRKKVSAVLGQFPESPAKHFLSTEKDFDVFGKFGINTIPAVFVYDREGKQIFPPTAKDDNAGTSVGSSSLETTEVSYERNIIPLLRRVAMVNEQGNSPAE